MSTETPTFNAIYTHIRIHHNKGNSYILILKKEGEKVTFHSTFLSLIFVQKTKEFACLTECTRNRFGRIHFFLARFFLLSFHAFYTLYSCRGSVVSNRISAELLLFRKSAFFQLLVPRQYLCERCMCVCIRIIRKMNSN